MKSIADITSKIKIKKDTRNSYEYQAYGNRLCEELGDTAMRALYIRLAKNEDRNLLEKARLHALSNEKNPTKGKVFMWKLTQLKKEQKWIYLFSNIIEYL